MAKRLRAAVCAAAAGVWLGCSHTVGFHPLTQAPPELEASKTAASVRLYMSPELQAASNTFRAVLNSWTIVYGERTHEFAVTYLEAAFTDFQEVMSPEKPDAPAVLVKIQSVEYLMEDQAAHIKVVVEASDGAGTSLLTKEYRADGWSGIGASMGGGPFAQKGITRSSTDQALKEIFLNVVRDLRRALPA